jgi:hypothetical protein
VRLGWAYRTLEGHLERGQIDYQVWKWLETGEVEYRIHAVAQVARTRRPVLDLGFRLVARGEQVRFARRCAQRMEQLIKSRLDGTRGEPTPRAAAGILASPTCPLI